MRSRPDRQRLVLVLAALLLARSVAAAPTAEEAPGGGLLGLGKLGGNRKDPITVTADNLEYDYKANVVVYRGSVEVVQGDVKLKSDNLTITLAAAPAAPKPAGAAGDAPAEPAAPAAPAEPDESARVQEIVATGNVRIDQGARWAVGGRAVFDQGKRTLILTDTPVLHEGKNEVAGDRVVVYLDEDRSVVEGGRKRVKAVLFPGKDGAAIAPDKPKRAGGAAKKAAEE
ncbi:MAG TPA: LptA/OstA family protein [Candidatus Binatia bacterium]|jgi:lipopolysaccharide export system protein LptA|nr:LptA/OstA family protein [Candidatus Binatia bacterium]